jgi:hypothetical protein
VRRWLLAAGLALVVAVGVSTVPGRDDAAPRAPGPSATATPGTTPPLGGGALDHEDDYTASAEELLGHVDHLDFDRLPADTRRELEAMLTRRAGERSGLWTAYGPALTRTSSPPLPTEAAVLDVDEFAYVLMTVRAMALADAVDRYGSLEAARSRPEVGPDHESVTATAEPAAAAPGTCVTVAWAGDPYGRTFSARSGAAGGRPTQDRLEREVTVGIAGEPGCTGQPPSFSPAAARALPAMTGAS